MKVMHSNRSDPGERASAPAGSTGHTADGAADPGSAGPAPAGSTTSGAQLAGHGVPAGAQTLLQVRGLRKHFVRTDGTRVPAIDDVSFDLHAGEFMVLLGPSGCGKKTLLRT